MLTFEDYQMLTESKQAEVIIKGEFLADREENGLMVQLYSLNKFYGELYYDPRVNRIIRFRAFDTISELAPYFAHIKFNAR